jgi:hypothetical protein
VKRLAMSVNELEEKQFFLGDRHCQQLKGIEKSEESH